MDRKVAEIKNVYGHTKKFTSSLMFNTPYEKESRPKRNEPCHCGSEIKYKKCCMKSDTVKDNAEYERQKNDKGIFGNMIRTIAADGQKKIDGVLGDTFIIEEHKKR